MIYAAWAMANLATPNQTRYKVSSRQYATLREQYSNQIKERMTGKKKRPLSEETRRKIGEASKGRGKGIPMSDESKKKLSKSMKGKNVGKVRSDEFKKKVSNSLKGRLGKPHTEESKEKIRQFNLGKKKGPQEKVLCPHCGKIGGKAPMARFHFDNCKHKK